MIRTVEETAKYLRISTQQVRKLISIGRLKATNIGQGKLRKEFRVKIEDIQEFLQQNEEVKA